MLNAQQIQIIQQKIGYNFKDTNLLQTAFTHSSYAFSHKVQNNELLEFLGDSGLNFCTTMFLYDNFCLSEGDSSKIRAYLVSSDNVSKFIFNNKLEDFLFCDHFNPKNSTNVMGDLFEAIVGAIFKDSGLEDCKNFIYKSLNYSKELIEQIVKNKKDYKTELQEFVQAQGGKLEYKLLSKTGPAHNPEFLVQVYVNDVAYAKAMAHSKKEAENTCAMLTLHELKNN